MKTETEELARDCNMLRAFMIAELPPGWTREVDEEYNIVYYDHVNNEATYTHPLSKEFRLKFHKIYKQNELSQRDHLIPKLNFKKDNDIKNSHKKQEINSNKNIVVDTETYRKVLFRQTMARIRQETQKDISRRVVIGSSLSKKILDVDKVGNKKNKDKDKDKIPQFELMYHEDSIKAKSRFRKLVHKSITDRKSETERMFEHEYFTLDINNEKLIEYYYNINVLDLIKDKIPQNDNDFNMNVPDIEYLISMSEHYGINPRREPHLLWILRLAEHMPLPYQWIEYTKFDQVSKTNK